MDHFNFSVDFQGSLSWLVLDEFLWWWPITFNIDAYRNLGILAGSSEETWIVLEKQGIGKTLFR